MGKIIYPKEIKGRKEASVITILIEKHVLFYLADSHHNYCWGTASSDDWAFIEANQFSHGVASIY